MNGVQQQHGVDYEQLGRTLVFRHELAEEGRLGFWRWLSLFLGVAGTYRKNDTVDVVYTLTNGAYNTQVIANEMYSQLYSANQQGRASAIAVILLLAIVPIMAFNVRRFQAQEAIR